MTASTNIHYNIAALIICVAVVIQYLCIKHVKSKTMVAYIAMLSSQFIACILSTAIYLMSQYSPENRILIYLFGTLEYIASFSVSVIYLFFFINLIRKDRKYTIAEKAHVLVPGLTVVGLILSTPFTHFIFYLNESNVLVRGDYEYVIFAVGYVYLIVSIILAFRHKQALTTSQAIVVLLYSFIIVSSTLVQILAKDVLLVNFGQTLALFLILVSMQNDMDDEDKILGTFSENAFSKFLFNKTQKSTNMFVVSIKFHDFTDVNRLVGFDEANEILRGVAEKIMDITPGKMVFHTKGIKLNCILLKDYAYVEQYVSRLEFLLKSPVKIDGEEVHLSYSLLVCESPKFGKRAEEIINLIDYTLFCFKNQKDVIWVDSDLYNHFLRKNVVEKAIERGLKEDNFIVYYQPIMSTLENYVKSAEALVRLNDPVHGMIYPDEFIPIAENNGTILDIDALVFEKVCRFISREKLWEKNIAYVEVNLSPIECVQENLHKKIIDVMDKYEIDRNLINLEITETAAVSDNCNANDNISFLINAGLTFSLDDFGTGFSNTTQLIELPFKMIKVDKSILWLAMKENQALSVLKHTISMLHDLYREIVVEGVETKEQADLLTELGCQHLQGYYYSRPLSEDDFLEYIQRTA